MNERLKLREVEHNKILQSYENSKRAIENQQTLERNKLEKAYKVRPGTATLEFLNLNIDTKASLPHSNYLSRIFIAKHNRERSLDTMIFGVK